MNVNSATNNNNNNNIIVVIMNHDQYIHRVALHLVTKDTLQGLTCTEKLTVLLHPVLVS